MVPSPTHMLDTWQPEITRGVGHAEDLDEFSAAKQGVVTIMQGLCAQAALRLFRALAAAGMPVRFAIGQHHCFCMVGDLIVDVTAGQFRNADPVEGVWIADRTDPDIAADPGVWRISQTFLTERDVLRSPIWAFWPEAERPQEISEEITQPRPR